MPVSHSHERSCGASATPDIKSSDAAKGTCTIARGGVEYRLHEFGLMYPSHKFSYWPGFSLNPALWDLRRLDESYRRKYQRQFDFDTADVRQVVSCVVKSMACMPVTAGDDTCPCDSLEHIRHYPSP